MAEQGIVKSLKRAAKSCLGIVMTPQQIERLRSKVLPHDVIYNEEYFMRDIEPAAAESAPTIAATIIEDLSPKEVIDVGCGSGALLHALTQGGCKGIGLEYAEAGLNYCRQRSLDVRKFNIERDDFEEDRTFDVAISMEVAEHLPSENADRYVGLLAKLSDIVVFTAAGPSQGGTDHVNEQPREYWLDKFGKHNLALDNALCESWREKWKQSGKVQSWYYDNLMVFRKQS